MTIVKVTIVKVTIVMFFKNLKLVLKDRLLRCFPKLGGLFFKVDDFWLNLSANNVTPASWLVSDDLVTKEYYSLILGKDERTLQRWEGGIIRQCKITAWRYYDHALPITCIPMLDGYRRLILLLIADRRKRGDSYEEILSQLRSHGSKISRDKFKQWRASYYDEPQGSN